MTPEQRAELVTNETQLMAHQRFLPVGESLQLRETDESDTPQIFLYGSMTGRSYMVEDWLGEYEETIEPGAFKNTLRKNPDVSLLFNHEGMPLARTKAKGQRTGTLEIGEDDKGFWGLADVNLQRSDVNNAYLALQDGDIRETSFAFRARRQEWNEDYTVRRVLEVEMNRGDLSLVTHGANPYGSAEARSAQCAQCRSLDKPA